MTPLEKAHAALQKIDAIPPTASVSVDQIKALKRDIVRLEYLIETADEHMCALLRATQTPLKVSSTDFTNALMVLAELERQGTTRL